MNRRDFLQSSIAGLGLRPLLAQAVSAGLQLELRQEETRENRPRFGVTFLNGSSSPLVLDVGVVLGNGAYASGVQFSLKDSRGRVRLLTKRDPGYIAGSVAPYIVKLSSGGAFRLFSIDLIDYWSHEPRVAILHLPVGVYSLVASFQGRDPNQDFIPAPGQPSIIRWPQTFWTGKVLSNALNVRFTSPVESRVNTALAADPT